MFQPNPPSPRAMPDSELNAKIAELQLQPDGLVAAMALIEQQSRLRQEDSLELSKWQLASQMHAATSPAPESPELQDPAFASPTINQPIAAGAQSFEQPLDLDDKTIQAVASPEPEIDIFANLSAGGASQFPANPIAREDSSLVASSELPTKPVAENLEDIVALLNASYAEVATTAEAQPQVAEIPIEQPASLMEEAVPEPIESPVEFSATAEEPLERGLQANPELEIAPFQKTGTASAFSWSWLAIAATPMALVVAAIVKEQGASLSQGMILLAGVLLVTSCLAAVGSMSAAKAGSSLTVVSRAVFGVWGNYLPAALLLSVQLFWSAALVYFGARIVSPLVSNQPWFANLAEPLVFPAEFTASLFVVVPLLVFSAIAAGIGGIVMLRLQQLSAVVSFVAIGTFAYFVISTYSLLDIAPGDAIPQANIFDIGLLLLAGFGFATVSLSGDFARKLSPETPGAKVFFLTFISTFFIPFTVGVLGLLWLFMAGDTLGSSFSTEAFATLASSAPLWVFVIFVAALGISIIQLIAASLYSSSGTMLGLIRLPGWASHLVILLIVLLAVLIPSYLLIVSTLQEVIVELLLLAAVVAAAWIGLVSSDALVRSRGYHQVSLTREYGFYGRMNITNTIGFVSAVVLGLGYLNGGPQFMAWSGYLGDLTPAIFELTGSNVGIAMAFGLAALFPVVFGIPKIRKQEQNLSELDQRREELKEFLDAAQ